MLLRLLKPMMHSADCRVQTGRARQGAVYVTDNLGDEHLARSQAVFGVYLRQGNARPCTRRRYRYSCPLFFYRKHCSTAYTHGDSVCSSALNIVVGKVGKLY